MIVISRILLGLASLLGRLSEASYRYLAAADSPGPAHHAWSTNTSLILAATAPASS